MPPANPTFEPGDEDFGDPVFCATIDPDPHGRFQKYRDEREGLFAGDVPDEVVDDHYWWVLYFSAPVSSEEPHQIDPDEVEDLSVDDIQVLTFTDNLTGRRITAEQLVAFAENYGLGTARDHAIDYLEQHAS